MSLVQMVDDCLHDLLRDVQGVLDEKLARRLQKRLTKRFFAGNALQNAESVFGWSEPNGFAGWEDDALSFKGEQQAKIRTTELAQLLREPVFGPVQIIAGTWCSISV